MVSLLRSRASTTFIHAVLGLLFTLPEASRRLFFAAVEAAARPFPWVHDLRLTGGATALALILRAQVIIARLFIACTVVAASPSAALAATENAAPLHCKCKPFADCWEFGALCETSYAFCSGVVAHCTAASH